MQPGDEVLLMSGQYGDISIGTYAVQTTNSDFVTIAAAPGQTPTLASLALTATNMWRFQHLSVQSIEKSRAIVVADQGLLASHLRHNLQLNCCWLARARRRMDAG